MTWQTGRHRRRWRAQRARLRGLPGPAGLDVLVLERRGVLGGAAVTEEPWPGYRISSASYVVSLMPPQIVAELELKRFGYKVTILDPDYYVPYKDGTSLTLWGDVQRSCRRDRTLSKRDADAYLEFDRYFEHVGNLLREMLFVVPPNLSLRDLPRWLKVGGHFRKWTGRDVAEIGPAVHDERGRLPRRVVRGRAGQGRARLPRRSSARGAAR